MIMPLSEIDPTLKIGPCHQPGCTNDSKRRVKGWCGMHWMRLKKGAPAMDAPARKYYLPYTSSRVCEVEECSRLVKARRLCDRHYTEAHRSNSLDLYTKVICPVDGNDAQRSGVCSRHYEVHRAYGWKGITALMVYAAEGCAICGNKERQPHIDHDHSCCGPVGGKNLLRRTCGKCVRDALCSQCNVGIGYFSESVEKMHQAIAYLQKWEVK